MLEYIKRDRQLSFSHWRYRLLHWTFGVKAETPSESKLPNFFYTHYCPLFHFTNLLAILSPFIILFKLIFKLRYLVIWPLVGLAKLVEAAAERHNNDPKVKEARKQYEIKHIKKKLARRCKEDGFNRVLQDLEYIDIYPMEHEEAEAYVLKLKEKYSEQIAAEKVENQERFVFWIRFSQIFVKALSAVVLLTAAFFTLRGLYIGVPYLCSGIWYLGSELIAFIFSASGADFLDLLLKTVGIVIGFLGTVFLGIFVIQALASYLSTPLGILKKGAGQAFEQFYEGCGSVGKFLEALYEDNCPAVTIVSEDEEED